MSEITVEKLSYFHGKDTPYEIKALDEIDLKIQKGMITGLIGHTGSGKSTLVQMFNGILRPHEGKVLLDGEDIWKRPKDIRKIRFRVGLVMQYPEYQLFEETCEKDIAFGPKNMGLDDEEIKRRVMMAADFVGLDTELLPKSPFELSGGQKRRVALAGIMAMEPEVLILDEPAAGLDPIGRTEIFGGIRRYQRTKGNTVIIVSHSMEDVAEYCDTLSVLRKGELLLSGECGSVFSHEKELVETGLGVPQITRFMRILREGGMPVRDDIYTIDEAYREITKMLGAAK